MKLFSLLVLATLTCRVCVAQNTRTPVLLELFTSEGCSSCPPADQLLTTLDRKQPVPDVSLIVLSEHVDYWNQAGWVDPYSAPLFSRRQENYANLLRVPDVYTPQLVVDGTSQLVGGNWPKVKAAIESAKHASKLAVSLQPSRTGSNPTLAVKVSGDPNLPSGDVYLVLAANATETQVRGGENSGRNLSHTAVAFSVTKVGKVSAQSAFDRTLKIASQAKWGSPVRTVVFVQDPATGRILGVSQAAL
ncbi:MAG: DUF1223 domain-containing protein [Acidobacteriaceae bacterium]|nr:DUF1223 domain-containing protein [Acidobacteriaceae bacterium]